jgi:hypothetical protein
LKGLPVKEVGHLPGRALMVNRNNILSHPSVTRLEVCAPQGTSPHKVLAIELADDMVASSGEVAVILLDHPPGDGEPGAIRAAGETFVGFLCFGAGGSVTLRGENADEGSRQFDPGTFEILGWVYRICACHINGTCRSVTPINSGEAALMFAVK